MLGTFEAYFGKVFLEIQILVALNIEWFIVTNNKQMGEPIVISEMERINCTIKPQWFSARQGEKRRQNVGEYYNISPTGEVFLT